MRFVRIFMTLIFTFAIGASCSSEAQSGCASGNCENGIGIRRLVDRSNGVEFQYEGAFQNGLAHGHGEDKMFLNGRLRSHYSGDFVRDKSAGKGRLLYYDTASGKPESEYVGEFAAGTFHGEGVMFTYLADGTRAAVYRGAWQAGLRHGYGLEYFPLDGSVDREGIWENGEFIREEKGTTP